MLYCPGISHVDLPICNFHVSLFHVLTTFAFISALSTVALSSSPSLCCRSKWSLDPSIRTFSETIEYEGENIPGLPTKYDYEYDGTTGYLTITAEGKAADCVLGEPDTTTSGASVVKTIQVIIIMSLVVTLYF